MHLVYPPVLWLLVLVPLWALWPRRRAALRYPYLPLLQGLPRGRARRAAVLGGLWRSAVLALLIGALARPRWPDPSPPVTVLSLALIPVLDVSGSMGETDFVRDGRPVSRLEAARGTLRQLLVGDGGDLAGWPDDLIGLVTFAAREEAVCPPTLNHASVLKLLDGAQPLGTPPDSSTNIGDALARAVELLKHARPREKVILLLSDGEHNVPPDVVPGALKPRQAAQLARGLGIRVHTVFVGPGEPPPPPPPSPTGGGGGSKTEPPTAASPQGAVSEAEQALRDVAAITGGKAFRAADAAGLRAMARQVDRLERSRVAGQQVYRYQDGYPWLGLAALGILILGSGWEGLRWRRIP